jgi:transposase
VIKIEAVNPRRSQSFMSKAKCLRHIPVQLTLDQFNQFILKHLPKPKRGPSCKISLFKVFNYILNILYTGCQWISLPIATNSKTGKPEIHYTRIFRIFQCWLKKGVFEKIFEDSVVSLHLKGLLDLSILHGDGTSTIAKKGGDCLGFSGHKHFKGEKTVAFVDRNCNVIAPFTKAPGNKHECPLFPNAFGHLKRIIKTLGEKLTGLVTSLDSAYDSATNRKMIFNAGMVPNIKENPRNRKKTKRGRKRVYEEDIFQERFETVERAFAWEDKFKRLLIRFERISLHHFGLKLIAYTMINLRHFCN